MNATFWVSYVHRIFSVDDEVLLPSFDMPAVIEAGDFLRAAQKRAADLAEGSMEDGLLVTGPIQSPTSAVEHHLFQLVPPRRNWSVKEK